jgi:hypothetical protein
MRSNYSLYPIFFLLITAFPFSFLKAQPIGLGQWRVHLPYNNCHIITETPDRYYIAADKGFFALNKGDASFERLSKVNGFSENEVQDIAYDPETNLTWIGYKNTKIDVVKNSRITPLLDFFRTNVVGAKEIYHISFRNKRAYFSTSIGIIVYDQEKLEVTESFLELGQSGNPTIKVFQTAIARDTIMAATETGILLAEFKTGITLSDFNNWTKVAVSEKSQNVVEHHGVFYAEVDSVLNYWNGSSWQVFLPAQNSLVRSLKQTNNHLVICMNNKIIIIRPDKSIAQIQVNNIMQGIVDSENSLWYVTNQFGLIKLNRDSTSTYYNLNGPRTSDAYAMINYKNDFWVTSGGPNPGYGFSYNSGKYNIFRDQKWVHAENNPIINPVHDMTNMAVSPDGNTLFIGSHGKGVVEIRNNLPINRYTYVNSTLGYTYTGDTITYATGIAMDGDGNLWVTNYDHDSVLHVYTKDKIWKAFRMPTVKGGALVIDDNNYKWFATPRTSGVGQNIGICVYDDNRTPLDQTDDRVRTLNTQPGSGLLPTNEIRCLLKTRNNEIWVGTDAGLVKFLNPGRVFTQEFYESERTIIEQSGYGGYLLGDEVIYSMSLDGAGRVWVGTNKGAWLIARNGRDILLNFNIDNSPLPSNNVFSVGIQNETGEVFFGTDLGLISYRGDATNPEEKLGKLKIFPNPVRETFDGLVSIEGLTEEARVKITDINGHLIFETVSQGGRATWNCRTFSGFRPATGVYLVFAIDKNGEESSMGKILFIR